MDTELRVIPITDLIYDRSDSRIGWAVSAVFVSAPNVEPRCVDYRVRAIKRAPSPAGDILNALDTQKRMEDAGVTVSELAEFEDFPRAGIPLYVFESASQARLLEKLRTWVDEEPERFTPALREKVARTSLTRGESKKTGRPPTRSTSEKLKILSDVVNGYAAGETRAEIAARHYMSDSALRDLIHWSRRVADPPLLTDIRHGQKGAYFTAEAKAMLEEENNG